jgi:hypothetical protein
MMDGLEFRITPTAGQPPIGAVFSGTFTMFGRTVPLPGGAWTVLTAQSRRDPETGEISGGVALVQRDGATLRGVVQAIVTDRKMVGGGDVSAVCTSSDVLWNDIRQAIPFGTQDCTSVYFERPDLWWAIGFTLPAQVMTSLKDADINVPKVVVALHVYEAGPAAVLTESIAVNPEIRGIAPDAYTARGQSSWTAFSLANDPAKQKLLDSLKSLAGSVRTTLRQQADLPAPVGAPPK